MDSANLHRFHGERLARSRGCTPHVGPIGTVPGYYEAGLVSNGDPGVAFGPKPDAEGHFSWANGSRLYCSNLTEQRDASGAIRGVEARLPCRGPTTLRPQRRAFKARGWSLSSFRSNPPRPSATNRRSGPTTNASGAPTGFSQLHRGVVGDPRGSAQNNQVLEFLGDYVYAAATHTFVVGVWNDVRQAADCPAIDAWRASVQAGTPITHPRPQVDCPLTFGNSDVFGGAFLDPTP